MRRLLFCTLGAAIFGFANCVAAEDVAAEKRNLQRKLYRDVHALLDETDLGTGSPKTMLSRSTETPCVIAVLRTADAISGGHEVKISVDLRQMDFKAVVPGVHVSTWQGVDYRTHALFIEHTKTAGVTVNLVEYREKANEDGFSLVRLKWNEPHVGVVPRRSLGLLHDSALSAEADRMNVQRLHSALAEFVSACRE